MFGQSLFDRFFDQFDVVLLMLERPAVQRQLLVLALLALAAELIAWQLADLRRQFFTRYEGAAAPHGLRARLGSNRTLRRWLRALEHTYSPIVTIVLGQLAVLAFHNSGWQAGLLRQGLFFFWLLLVYRLIVTALYAWQSEKRACFYHQRLLLPLFLLLLIFAVQRVLSGIVDLAGIRLFVFSENEITLGAFFIAAFLFYGFLILSWVTQGVLDRFILPRMSTDQGVNNTIRTVMRYVMISAGILIALGSLGLDLSTLAIIGAGLSVGIGFGLQELVANFVAGILLLFEQSIRPGDVIKVEGQVGRVEKLRIRSTTVRTNENVEMIIPNQTLLTSAVTTYTHSESDVRVSIPVGVSYECDPQEVRQILLTAVGRHGLVRKNPPPVVFFCGYGNSSVDFEVAVWIDDYMNQARVTSDLRFIIWEELAKRGIEIPFPQRDLHVRSGIPWEDLLARFPASAVDDATADRDGAGGEQQPTADEAGAKESPLKRLGKLP